MAELNITGSDPGLGSNKGIYTCPFRPLSDLRRSTMPTDMAGRDITGSDPGFKVL
jgi:hypothetical protein